MSLTACMSRCPTTTRCPQLSYSLAPANASSTDGPASLACRNNGSSSSSPSSSAIQERVPTLPTPTTLRAKSTQAVLVDRTRRSCSRVARYERACRADPARPLRADPRRARSPKRHDQRRVARRSAADRPAIPAKRFSAPRLSFVRAFADRALEACGGRPCRVRCAAAPGSRRPRHGRTRPRARASRRTRASPCGTRATAATTMLARCLGGEAVVPRGDLQARRQALDVPLPRPGMGLVEVVDVEDQAGAPGRRTPRSCDRWASPQSLDDDTGARRAREVARHRQRRAAVEGERRDRHPSVADRQQFRYPGSRLAFQHGNGIRSPGSRRELRMARSRDRCAGCLSQRYPLFPGQVGLLGLSVANALAAHGGGRRHREPSSSECASCTEMRFNPETACVPRRGHVGSTSTRLAPRGASRRSGARTRRRRWSRRSPAAGAACGVAVETHHELLADLPADRGLDHVRRVGEQPDEPGDPHM